MAAANWNNTVKKRDATVRQQLLTPPSKSRCPIRAAWAEPNLRVEKLDVRLVETRFLDRQRLVRV